MEINAVNNIAKVNSKETKEVKQELKESIKEKEVKDISNICYRPISFGRSLQEHKSWGASIDPKTKSVSFKILTFPDAKKVTVNVINKNNPQNTKTYKLANKGDGIFQTLKKIPQSEISAGDKYFYTIEKADETSVNVKDPYTYKQESILGASTLYDHSEYKWNDDSWFSDNKDRISRKANSTNNLTSLKEAKIYELNVATFSKKGTFESAIPKLKSLKQEGFNTIEIMPAENTYSFNWGYDGVDKLAAAEHLGGPDGLKKLVNYAHNIGLNVIMDIVPNHIGPDGAALAKTGPYVKGTNCFGESWNFEGNNSRYVRDFMVNAALNWLDNYHCDGLRFDMTKFMESDYTMKQIAAEINYHKPDAFLIAEDSRRNVSIDANGNSYNNWDEPHDKRVINPLHQYESGEGENEEYHCKAIENISSNNGSLDRLGFDSEWDFNYFHTLKDGLYGVVNLDELEKACYCSQDRIKYVMSHDEIGNFEGSRLISKLMVPMLHLNDHIILNDEDKKRAADLSKLKNMPIENAQQTVLFQKAQLTSEKLAIMLQTGKLDKYDTKELSNKRWIQAVEKAFKDEVLIPLGIDTASGITFDIVKTMFNKSLNINKMALARTYSIPGPKMVFQGDDKADLTPFRFFRQFDSVKNEDYLYTEKGYKTNIEALKASTLGNIKYSENGKTTLNKFRNLVKDLNAINSANPALTKGHLIQQDTVKHPASQVIATNSKDNASGNEIFTITNFGDINFPREDAADYYIKFPEGEWIEILNTDDKKYGGSGSYNNTSKIQSNGFDNSPIKLAGSSTIMFKRVG